MTKPFHPSKETHKVCPVPDSDAHDHAGDTLFVRAGRRSGNAIRKHWGKGLLAAFILAVVGGIGTWIGNTSMEWMNNHHFVTTAEQGMIRSNYWQNVAIRRDLNNLKQQIKAIDNESAVGKNSQKYPLTANRTGEIVVP